MNKILNRIEHFLKNENLDCSILKPTKKQQTIALAVYLGKDNKNRERLLEITSEEQLMNLGAHHKNSPSQIHYHHVQFRALFPFKLEPFAVAEVSSLLHFLNHMLPIPGLEMNEIEHQILYRYVLMTNENQIDPIIISAIVGFILFILNAFSNSIESVALKEKKFNDILDEVLDSLKKI